MKKMEIRNDRYRNSDISIRTHFLDLEDISREVLLSAGLERRKGRYFFKLNDVIYKIVRSTLESERKILKCELDIVFTTNNMLKQLNKRYLMKNQETDVLCFPYSNKPPYRADIVISIEKAYQQCKLFGNTPLQEVFTLIVHALLHLLGYRDDIKEFKKKMFEKQDTLLKEFNIK